MAPESVGGPTVAVQLQNSLRNLMIATLILYIVTSVLAVGGVLFALNQNQKTRDIVADNKELATSTTAALCTFRFDLQQRVDQSKEFLKENPEGIPGIPAETLRQTIEGQERTIASLDSLHCPPQEVTKP